MSQKNCLADINDIKIAAGLSPACAIDFLEKNESNIFLKSVVALFLCSVSVI